MFAIFLIWNASSSQRGHLANLRRYLAKEEGKQRKTLQGLRGETNSARDSGPSRKHQREA
jgi:hypothetical protein